MINKGYNFYLLHLSKQIVKMKKVIIGIVVALLVIFVARQFLYPKKTETSNGGQKPEPEGPLAISKNSAAFNESFEKLLNSYFSLKSKSTNIVSQNNCIYMSYLQYFETTNLILG